MILEEDIITTYRKTDPDHPIFRQCMASCLHHI